MDTGEALHYDVLRQNFLPLCLFEVREEEEVKRMRQANEDLELCMLQVYALKLANTADFLFPRPMVRYCLHFVIDSHCLEPWSLGALVPIDRLQPSSDVMEGWQSCTCITKTCKTMC